MGERLTIDVGEPEIIIPSGRVPSSIRPMRSNNNLDICRHEGRLYLAYRTGPIHFASRYVRIEVVSFDVDASGREVAGGTWRAETTVVMGCDLREPRLVSHDGRLLLFFFDAGTHVAKFEPQFIRMSERTPSGVWTAPVVVSDHDHIDWRIRSVGGQLVMSCYGDASGAYTTDRSPRAKLLRSDDGRSWSTLFDTEVLEPGTTETDFVVREGGDYLLVSRKESRGSGLGTVIARLTSSGNTIEVRHDTRKFDSPALFDWNGRTFIVTRRQLAFGGRTDVMPPALPREWRDVGNQGAYWLTPKTTALYEIDRSTLEPSYVRDLPGCGDTAFAAIDANDDGSVTVYNYSSSFWMTYAPWMVGQLMPTQIHRVRLTMG